MPRPGPKDYVARAKRTRIVNIFKVIVLCGAGAYAVYQAMAISASLSPSSLQLQIGQRILEIAGGSVVVFIIMSLGGWLTLVEAKYHLRLANCYRAALHVVRQGLPEAPVVSVQPMTLPLESLTSDTTLFGPYQHPASRAGRVNTGIGVLELLAGF